MLKQVSGRKSLSSMFADKWIFYVQQGRYEQWRVLDNPPLPDWQEMLDAVERRASRHLLRSEDVKQLRKTILQRFPGSISE